MTCKDCNKFVDDECKNSDSKHFKKVVLEDDGCDKGALVEKAK